MKRQYWLWAGAVFALWSCVGHGFMADGLFLELLFAHPDLPANFRTMGYVSWHILTLLFAVFAVAYVMAALQPAHLSLARHVAALNVLLALLVLFIALTGHSVMFSLPAMYFFAIIAALGFIGARSA